MVIFESVLNEEPLLITSTQKKPRKNPNDFSTTKERKMHFIKNISPEKKCYEK